MPMQLAASAPAAYYHPCSRVAGRPGIFSINTFDLTVRPKWAMPALAAHEAVPGHHLQIALADELTEVHELRRYGRWNAFVEGWGLYAEGLAAEMGLYKTPYENYGRLTFEMWRAIRLVVDTGIHAFGWSRERACEFFADHTSMAQHEIEAEVDRYIAWPGQALGYKLGELRIRSLRQKAEQELGDRFDLRAFHDTVIGSGPLPLSILDQIVEKWIHDTASR